MERDSHGSVPTTGTARDGAAPLVALTEGFRAAFGVTIGSAVIALVAALLLLRPNRPTVPVRAAPARH